MRDVVLSGSGVFGVLTLVGVFLRCLRSPVVGRRSLGAAIFVVVVWSLLRRGKSDRQHARQVIKLLLQDRHLR